MSKRHFISFGGPTANFHKRVYTICGEAIESKWFDEVKTFTDLDLKLDDDFWHKHGNFLETNTRGYGYWLWKPYIIYKTLMKMQTDDFLVYADAGCSINIEGFARFQEYMGMLEKSSFGLICFQLNGCREIQYTKREVLHYFDLPDNWIQSDQIMGTVIMIKKTSYTMALVEEWYNTASLYNLINDSKCMEDSTFIDHRHDQSIFSMVVKKYQDNIPYLPTPIVIPDETFFHPNWKNGQNYPFWATRIKT